MKKPSSDKDPHQKREAARYAQPIPSREFILEVLTAAGKPLPAAAIGEQLKLAEDWARQALAKRLAAMVREGQLLLDRRGRYGPVAQMDLLRGRVTARPDGYGFFIPDGDHADLYLSPREMRAVMDGDRVVASVTKIDARGRFEGSIVEVLERRHRRVVGHYRRDGKVAWLIPDDRRLAGEILVTDSAVGRVRDGQIAVVEIIQYADRRQPARGMLVELLGERLAPGMEIDIALRSHDLPWQWPPEVEQQAAGFAQRVSATDKTGREDYTQLPLITIDGEDARDFDDAVYAERAGRGWRLLVAIADVSHYVLPASAIDIEAELRGTSVYFPQRVIPMLPEVLSNELCSLKPDTERLALVCEMHISTTGVVRDHRFVRGVIRSHARTTYTDIAAVLGDDPTQRARYQALLPQIEALHGVYLALDGERRRRGAVEFETTEARIVFGPDRKIERIEPLMRNIAHCLIEECMIAANRSAARFLMARELPALYRVHDHPKPEKVTGLRTFLAEFGLKLGGGDEPSSADYRALTESVADRPDRYLLQTVILRSFKQAIYDAESRGHFGLALDAYAHFTSPIRRYPDLLVHRAIVHALGGRKASSYLYSAERMATFGEHCSMTERRADDATREVVAWLKCEFLQDRVGEVLGGIISGVAAFGLFVTLDGAYTEGLVHITALPEDYYHFDPIHHHLTGERRRRTFRLGDRLQVRVVRVDLDERKIDLDYAGPG
ncbi:ribonuclease R [Immundisolibacter sp.]|uniref:ribonuclease R n=1 Tax=Immundisolibacter sp. TaxID=1934948 RepID=UPI003562F12A